MTTEAPQYGLNRDQLDFLEVIRQMVVEKVTPRAAEIDEKAEYPQDIRKLFADHDLFGLPFEEQYGGTGTGDLMLVAAIEEIAKGCASSSLMVAAQDLSSLPLKLHASDELKDRVLPKMASGEWIGAFCLSEPDAGSDPGQDRVQEGPDLAPGHLGPEAVVHTEAERQQLVGVGAVDVERHRVDEDVVVTVGRRVGGEHGVARRDGYAAELVVLLGPAHEAAHRAGPADHLLGGGAGDLRLGLDRSHAATLLGRAGWDGGVAGRPCHLGRHTAFRYRRQCRQPARLRTMSIPSRSVGKGRRSGSRLRAFTLVELLLVGALAALFLTAFWTVDDFTGQLVRTFTLKNYMPQ